MEAVESVSVVCVGAAVSRAEVTVRVDGPDKYPWQLDVTWVEDVMDASVVDCLGRDEDSPLSRVLVHDKQDCGFGVLLVVDALEEGNDLSHQLGGNRVSVPPV
jgi:hypothetical protein